MWKILRRQVDVPPDVSGAELGPVVLHYAPLSREPDATIAWQPEPRVREPWEDITTETRLREDPAMADDAADTAEMQRTPPEEVSGPTANRPHCPYCRGTGYVLTTNELLRESMDAFPTKDAAAMDEIIAEFYRRLVARDSSKPRGDQLGPLFPADLTTGDAINRQGHKQRDVLLHALVQAVAEYDPDAPDSPSMVHRERELERAGRTHASFRRPDGTERPPTPQEYAEVFEVLVGLLSDAFGAEWIGKYGVLWAEAYDDAVDVMRYAARDHRRHYRRELTGRMPRQAR